MWLHLSIQVIWQEWESLQYWGSDRWVSSILTPKLSLRAEKSLVALSSPNNEGCSYLTRVNWASILLHEHHLWSSISCLLADLTKLWPLLSSIGKKHGTPGRSKHVLTRLRAQDHISQTSRLNESWAAQEVTGCLGIWSWVSQGLLVPEAPWAYW